MLPGEPYVLANPAKWPAVHPEVPLGLESTDWHIEANWRAGKEMYRLRRLDEAEMPEPGFERVRLAPTPGDVAAGTPRDCYVCPYAFALRQALQCVQARVGRLRMEAEWGYGHVHSRSAWKVPGDRIYWATPADVAAWIERYDASDRSVGPLFGGEAPGPPPAMRIRAPQGLLRVSGEELRRRVEEYCP